MPHNKPARSLFKCKNGCTFTRLPNANLVQFGPVGMRLLLACDLCTHENCRTVGGVIKHTQTHTHNMSLFGFMGTNRKRKWSRVAVKRFKGLIPPTPQQCANFLFITKWYFLSVYSYILLKNVCLIS